MIDNYDQIGFPAEPPRTYRTRSVPTALSGQSQPGKPSHNAKPVAAEYGWLTPLRKSKGDPRLWFFRCRCGEELMREIGHVRRAERKGVVSKCKTCAAKTRSAGAKAASTSTTPGAKP